jgi:hypothetical protein
MGASTTRSSAMGALTTSCSSSTLGLWSFNQRNEELRNEEVNF